MALQFNDSTNLGGIKQDMYFLLGSNSGTAPDDYSANDQKRNINLWYRKAYTEVLKTISGWRIQDNIATTNLVSGTRSYQFSAGGGLNVSVANLIKIDRVEISYDSGATYYKAYPIQQADIPEGLANSSIDSKAGLADTSTPRYVLRDDYIDIYPSPTANSTNGIKIYYTKDVTDLSSDADRPNLPSIFDRYLSLGAAYDYAMSRGLPIASTLRQEVEIFAKELRDFMKERNDDQKFVMTSGSNSLTD